MTCAGAVAQALAVAPLFRALCAGWASTSNGCLHTSGSIDSACDLMVAAQIKQLVTAFDGYSVSVPEAGMSNPREFALSNTACSGGRNMAVRNAGLSTNRQPAREFQFPPMKEAFGCAKDSASDTLQDGYYENMVPLAWRRCLKQPGRAMAKALWCYDGDVSRLVDICRVRIVFDTLEDLVACVRLVCAESAANGKGRQVFQIRRIRNSMQPGNNEPAVVTGRFRVRS